MSTVLATPSGASLDRALPASAPGSTDGDRRRTLRRFLLFIGLVGVAWLVGMLLQSSRAEAAPASPTPVGDSADAPGEVNQLLQGTVHSVKAALGSAPSTAPAAPVTVPGAVSRVTAASTGTLSSVARAVPVPAVAHVVAPVASQLSGALNGTVDRTTGAVAPVLDGVGGVIDRASGVLAPPAGSAALPTPVGASQSNTPSPNPRGTSKVETPAARLARSTAASAAATPDPTATSAASTASGAKTRPQARQPRPVRGATEPRGATTFGSATGPAGAVDASLTQGVVSRPSQSISRVPQPRPAPVLPAPPCAPAGSAPGSGGSSTTLAGLLPGGCARPDCPAVAAAAVAGPAGLPPAADDPPFSPD